MTYQDRQGETWLKGPSKTVRPDHNADLIVLCPGAAPGTRSKNALYPSISVYKSETSGQYQPTTTLL